MYPDPASTLCHRRQISIIPCSSRTIFPQPPRPARAEDCQLIKGTDKPPCTDPHITAAPFGSNSFHHCPLPMQSASPQTPPSPGMRAPTESFFSAHNCVLHRSQNPAFAFKSHSSLPCCFFTRLPARYGRQDALWPTRTFTTPPSSPRGHDGRHSKFGSKRRRTVRQRIALPHPQVSPGRRHRLHGGDGGTVEMRLMCALCALWGSRACALG